MNNSHFQIAVLPWIDIETAIQFGDFLFLPKEQYLSKMVDQKELEELSEYLNRYFGCYKDNHGNTVNLTVIAKETGIGPDHPRPRAMVARVRRPRTA